MKSSKELINLDGQNFCATQATLLGFLYLCTFYPDIKKQLDQINQKDQIGSLLIKLVADKHPAMPGIYSLIKDVNAMSNDLSWIDDSLRQLYFIESELSIFRGTLQNPVFLTSIKDLFGYTDKEKKVQMVSFYARLFNGVNLLQPDLNAALKTKWSLFSKSDVEFNWLLGENSDEARSYLWSYLFKNHSELIDVPLEPQDHERMIALFDRMKIGYTLKKDILRKAKRLWDKKQKTNQNNEKCQFNVQIPVSTIEAIGRLAKKYDFSKSDIVRIVMDAEAKTGYHLEKKSTYNKNMLDSHDYPVNQVAPLTTSPEINDVNKQSAQINLKE